MARKAADGNHRSASRTELPHEACCVNVSVKLLRPPRTRPTNKHRRASWTRRVFMPGHLDPLSPSDEAHARWCAGLKDIGSLPRTAVNRTCHHHTASRAVCEANRMGLNPCRFSPPSSLAESLGFTEGSCTMDRQSCPDDIGRWIREEPVPPSMDTHPLPYGGCHVDRLSAALPAGSPGLAAYLRRVYGSNGLPEERLHSWRWEEKDVLWVRHLNASVKAIACTPPFGQAPHPQFISAGQAFIAIAAADSWVRSFEATGLLWRFEASAACSASGDPYDRGGTSGRRGEVRRWVDPWTQTPGRPNEWVEISHVQIHGGKNNSATDQSEREFFWMYRARGSGLWYRPGWTHRRDDFHTARGDGRSQSWPDEPPAEASLTDKMRAMRSRGVETIELVKRVADYVGSVNRSGRCGPGARTPFYTHELVGLRPRVCGERATPCPGLCLPAVSALRFGWPENGERGAVCPATPFGCVNVRGRLLSCRM